MAKKKKKKRVKNQSTKFRKVVKRINPTDNFEMFISQIENNYLYDKKIETQYDENKEVETCCARMRVWEVHLTDTFKVLSEEYFLNLSSIFDGIHLHLLVVNPIHRNKGIGTKVMRMLKEISNSYGIPLYLIPIPLAGENIGYDVLKNFYHSNGFKRESTSRYWKYSPVAKQVEESMNNYRLAA